MLNIDQTFKEKLNDFIKSEITPFHREWEDNGLVDRKLFLKAGKEGFLCPSIPQELGGKGFPFVCKSSVEC